MKRLSCLLLVLCLLLSGCSTAGEWIKEPVTFYYVRENYQKDMDQVIVSEVREAAGHREDLSYLLALYSMGPSSEGMEYLFASNTYILPTERTSSRISLSLSPDDQNLTDADFTLAGTCIALTCMELIDVQEVTIICGDRNITILDDNLLIDYINKEPPQEETK